MAKKLIAGGAVVAAVLLYVIFGNRNDTSATGTENAVATAPVTNVTPAPSEPTNPSANTSGAGNPPTATPSPTPTPAQGQYKNGTYTGPATDAVYGTVQVQAVISGGKLTDVKFLQYPNSGGHTSEVSQFAIPQLKQEAIAAQSAQVDTVSGATQTSEAFQQSLGTALQQARA